MSASPIGLLSSLTKMPEEELARRVRGLVDPKTGKVRGLSALDAALASSSAGMKQTNAAAYTAAGSRSQTTHVIEEPAQAFARTTLQEGYALGADGGARPASTKALLEGASKTGVKRAQGMSAMFGDADQLEPDFLKLPGSPPAGGTATPAASGDGNMQQIQFEKMKQEMNKLTQMTDMLSNVLKTMNETGMTAIRNVKA